jgi:hypothetical protein
MEPRDTFDPNRPGWTEAEEVTPGGEPAPDDIVNAGTTTVDTTTSNAETGSGGAVHPSGTGWSEDVDSAEPEPDDVVSTGTTEVLRGSE